MTSIVLGVSGGVAAYKAAFVLRAFTEAGHDVRVVPTPGALNFVGAATFEALSGNRSPPTLVRRRPRSRTSGSASTPTSWSSPRPRPTCWPAPPWAARTTCSPPRC